MNRISIKSAFVAFFLWLPLSGVFAATASLTPTSNDYGNVAVGSSASQTFTLTYTGAAAGALTIASATVSGAPYLKVADNCTGSSIAAPGGSCTIEVQFNPTAVAVSTATLTVATNATDGTTKISGLRGTGVNGPTIGLSATSNDFGSVTIGSSSSFSLTVTNTGGTGNLTIASATVSAAPFLRASDTCTGASLVLAGTCTIDVQFNPTAAITSTGTLTIVTNAANGTSQVVSLIGIGVTGVTVTGSIAPASFNFGNVTIGSSSATTFTITNTGGTGNLTIASATVSAAPFLKTSDTCTGSSLPLLGTCTVGVSFVPTAVTSSAAILTVVTNATDGTNKITSLIGTGVTGITVTGSITPASFNFGSVTIGSPSATTFTITNTGGTGNLTIASATVSAAPFLKTSDTCTGSSLPLLGTCTVGVSFVPTAVTSSAGILTVVTNATDGTSKIASLNGAGVTGVTVTGSISPGTANFGSVAIGSSGTTTFTITNTGGTGNLTISSVAVSGAPFVITSDSCTAASLALLATCTVGVDFAPTTEGSFAGIVTVATNATNGINKIASLSGSTPSPGTLAFAPSGSYEFSDNVGTALIFVSRSGGSSGAVSVNFATAPGTASATAGDYDDTSSPPDSPLSWADGDSSPKIISIVIHPNSLTDQDRQFSVVLTDPSGGALLGDPNIATITLSPSLPSNAASSTAINTDGCSMTFRGVKNSPGFFGTLLFVACALMMVRRRFT